MEVDSSPKAVDPVLDKKGLAGRLWISVRTVDSWMRRRRVRARPEQIVEWAEQTGVLEAEGLVIDLPPWHYGYWLRWRRANGAIWGRYFGPNSTWAAVKSTQSSMR